MEQPNGVSKLCLSCYDGAVALDNFGWKTDDSNFISGTVFIGTNLSDDLPVSFEWGHQSSGPPWGCANCHNVHGSPTCVSNLVFFDGKVGCATCHDPHNSGSYDKVQRKIMADSSLCLHCHTGK